ncbi:MAG: hypothetical protein ACRC7N_11210 [Clostridium sp.]
MKFFKFNILKKIKQCWKQITFRDKGLILIMVILIMQCIYNLYSEVSTAEDYTAVNIIVRTSVASIFGYFLSSNFLMKIDTKKNNSTTEVKLEILDEILKSEDKDVCIESQSKLIKTLEQDEKEIEKTHICNTNLQNGVAIAICVITLLCLIIGINFGLIKEGSIVTISQFRDLIGGSIGFLLGSENK